MDARSSRFSCISGCRAVPTVVVGFHLSVVAGRSSRFPCVCVVADVREVFDLFDFWDGRDGLVDGFKLGDFLRCCGLNPTVGVVNESGGTKKLGRNSRICQRLNATIPGPRHFLRSRSLPSDLK